MKFEISCISGGHSPLAVAFSTLHNNTAEYRILSDPSLQEMEHQGLCCDWSQLWGLMMMRNWSFTLLYLKRTGPQCHNLSMSGKNINENVSLYRFPTFLGFLTFSFFCMRGSFQTVTENCIFLCFHGNQKASGALNSSFTTFKLCA